MTIQLGGIDFEHSSYDEVADVLYLRTERHQEGASTHGTPEGHAVRLDPDGNVVGMTIVNARWLVERDGALAISVPQKRIEASAKDVGIALQRIVSE